MCFLIVKSHGCLERKYKNIRKRMKTKEYENTAAWFQFNNYDVN